MVSVKQKIDLGQAIRDRVFEGNIHAQGAYFREALEVLMFYHKGLTPNSEQQKEIDKRMVEFDFLNEAICSMVGKPTLESIEEPIE